MGFSKWNRRITAWLLIAIGIYMGLKNYNLEIVIIFLGSGLSIIGYSIFSKK